MKTKWFEIDEAKFYTIATARTLRSAFEKSLAKWSLILDGLEPDNGIDSCGLCDLFNKDDCSGCPIRKITGRSYCEGTPYTLYMDSIQENGTDKINLAELNFLKAVKKAFLK